jgi:8-oxo-dGTP pyrophosphatase MutT (NUDIX family)
MNKDIQQFGKAEKDLRYTDRLGAYALIRREGGLIAAVENAYGNLHLPGGGVDEGEILEEALKREIMEEMGREVYSISFAGEAKQYSTGGINKLCNYFLVDLVPDKDQRGDSITRWVTLREFEKGALHEAHIWAVKQFLFAE